VVDDVRHEKERGGGERREHAALVLFDAAAPDQHIAGHEERRRGAVEDGVERRKVGYPHLLVGPSHRTTGRAVVAAGRSPSESCCE